MDFKAKKATLSPFSAWARERLVEAINAIQDDFEKIIVITHIDELKDAFPVRIEIWKTADGSRVAIR